MSVVSIIQHFQTSDTPVIWTDEVEEQVLRHLNGVRIVRRGVDVDANRVRGMFLGRRVIPEPEGSILMPLVEGRAIYSTRQSVEFQRLVLVKELLHCLDDEDVKTKSLTDALALCDQLANGEDSIAPQGDSVIQCAVDEMAKWMALAVLFPMRLRDTLEPSYRNHEISLAQVANYVRLPEEYAGYVMDPLWPRIYARIAR